MSLRLRMDYPSVPAFLAAFDSEMAGGSLTVSRPPGAGDVELFTPCDVELCLFGEPAILVSGWVTHSVPGAAVGVLLGGAPGELSGLVERLRKVAKHITAPSITPVSPSATSSPDLRAAAPASSSSLGAAIPARTSSSNLGAVASASSAGLGAAGPARTSSSNLGPPIPSRSSSSNLGPPIPSRTSSSNLGPPIPSRTSSSNLAAAVPSRTSSSNLGAVLSSRSSSPDLSASLPSRLPPSHLSAVPLAADDEEVVPPADEEARAAAQEPPAPRLPPSLAMRLDAMGASEKMRLAMSGNRDERLALLRDINRTLHGFVLRNPRIGLDEVQYASRLANLAPDAIKQISDHPQWGADPTVCAGLARNPKTPISIALRCLDRLGDHDLRLIARGGARQPIVAAARRKLAV